MNLKQWHSEYQKKIISLEELAGKIQSGDTVTLGFGVSGPSGQLVDAILDRNQELENVRICDVVLTKSSRLVDPGFMASIDGRINSMSGFCLKISRKIFKEQLVDFYPVQGDDAADKLNKITDVLIIMVTPPDSRGYVNFGLSNFYHTDMLMNRRESGFRLVIGEVNEQMPVVFGNNWAHISQFDFFVENSTPIPTLPKIVPTKFEINFANHVLELINDGDTIQMGVGGISEAVVASLDGKNNLGILSEMAPAGLGHLVEKGIVTNNCKPFHRGKSIATFCLGDQELYDYVTKNPVFELHPASYTNNPSFIASHPNMVAINSAIMVDFTGQIASEGVGDRHISGTGGQLNFQMGAFWSQGGRAITLVSSTSKLPDGSLTSNIVPELPLGTPVTVPRTFADYIITEYGVARLRYKTRRERALELISIAHPDFRGELRDRLKTKFYFQGPRVFRA
ncbi:MAG TPA: acetyl-CoA hydrolase/transferase C-terminal domain-containing protein [Tepidanaerobacteraceae bacterium]|nr:acetyl-CoA hydrolase/transferase C-terminal domain-containing protein [Tepidanaerobacteraceae bacterium]